MLLLCSKKWLWPRGRASVSLSEGRWFDFPGLHVEVSLGKILNPRPLLMLASMMSMMIGTSHSSHRHQCMNMYELP